MTFGDVCTAFFSQPRKIWACEPCAAFEVSKCCWKTEVKGPVEGKEYAQFTVLLTLSAGVGLAPFLQSFISVLCSEEWRKCTKKKSYSLQSAPRRLFAVNKNFHPVPINLLWRAHIFKRQFSNTSTAGSGEKVRFCSVAKWCNIADLPSGTFPVCIGP